MSVVKLRLAHGHSEIRAIADMWTRAAKRLANRGLDQWQYPVKVHNIESAVLNRTAWLVTNSADGLVGTITVDEYAAPNLWRPSDKPDEALYLHRMVIEPELSGTETGSALMDWAARRAQAMGKHWLRLDAWRNNPDLWKYYTKRGFTLVRVVDDPTGSGACFQRSAGVQLGVGPVVVEPLG